MARTIIHAKLETRAARARLKAGRQAHWRTLLTGRAHLGYRRRPAAPEGSWLLRRYIDGKYQVEALGAADDSRTADCQRVFSFEQAQAKGLALLDAPKAKRGRITVREALADYVAYKEAQGQPTADLKSRASAHIIPPLGDWFVEELTSERLRRWVADLASGPAMKRTKDGQAQQYKPPAEGEDAIRRRRSSANRVLTILKATLNHAYDEGHVSNREPWGRRLKPFRNVDAPRVRFLTIAEAQRLLNACDREFRPLVRGALVSGCRYGELIRVTVDDFRVATDTSGNVKGTLALARTKTGKPRNVVLTDEGIAFLQELTAGRAGDVLIFTRANGAPWKASQQGRPMREAVARARLATGISFHGLRHTWASLSVMNGMPLMVVAMNLGHVDTRMVERVYGHLSNDFINDAIRNSGPRFGFELNSILAVLR